MRSCFYLKSTNLVLKWLHPILNDDIFWIYGSIIVKTMPYLFLKLGDVVVGFSYLIVYLEENLVYRP